MGSLFDLIGSDEKKASVKKASPKAEGSMLQDFLAKLKDLVSEVEAACAGDEEEEEGEHIYGDTETDDKSEDSPQAVESENEEDADAEEDKPAPKADKNGSKKAAIILALKKKRGLA